LIIVAVTLVAAAVIHGYWFNLVPPAAFPVVLASSPLPLMLVLATPIIAIVLQYIAHARPAAIVTMDALFGIKQKGQALFRLVITILVLGVLVFAFRRIPPTLSVASEPRSDQQLAGLSRLYNCEAAGYPETTKMYVVRIRAGSYNPVYSLKTSVEFTPPNSVELCQIWADAGISAQNEPLVPQSDAKMPQRSQWVELRSSENGSAGWHRALFTLIRPRTATLSGNDTRIVVSVEGYPTISDALPVSEADWR
jgi:hypothetical protein